ncbi:hypothetical protein M422DRAFT_265848 [Sphaerobolus stellatus SS14]|uniref:30S ribosomal protein S15 n=1 Tax=Sphaerobolus stellatus (strain SS14) TaxID=990650 RepID=A0A0C9UCG2_SPHS4|nr:hypothetical protein M422DRAFT_265848 [Sphaerobolus stellatus SS14]
MSLSAALRPRVHRVLRNVIQSVPAASTSSFHTSVSLYASRSAHVKKGKKHKLEKTEVLKPDPITGHKPGDEEKWLKCDLAKILIPEIELLDPSVVLPELKTTDSLRLPESFQWGIGGDKKVQELLFDSLPRISAQHGILAQRMSTKQSRDAQYIKNEWKELKNANVFSRLVDLRNASATGIAFENRRRCIEAFSASGKPNDTGRPEVQAALSTMKIRRLHMHLQRNRKDIENRLSLRKLVHARARMLKYLRRLDRARFENVMKRLGMEESSIEGELMVYSKKK